MTIHESIVVATCLVLIGLDCPSGALLEAFNTVTTSCKNNLFTSVPKKGLLLKSLCNHSILRPGDLPDFNFVMGIYYLSVVVADTDSVIHLYPS